MRKVSGGVTSVLRRPLRVPQPALIHLNGRLQPAGGSTSRRTATSPCWEGNGWFFSGRRAARPSDYRYTDPFAQAELRAAGAPALRSSASDWLAARGAAYLFVVAPDKETIYPRVHAGRVLTRVGPRSRLDQLVAYLAPRTHGTLISSTCGTRCWRARQHERLYHKTDTHWNDRGAFLAYRPDRDGRRPDSRHPVAAQR